MSKMTSMQRPRPGNCGSGGSLEHMLIYTKNIDICIFDIYMHTWHILHIFCIYTVLCNTFHGLHVFSIVQHLKSVWIVLIAVRLLSDSDSDEDEHQEPDDVSIHDPPAEDLPQPPPPSSGRQADMRKSMQAAGGSNYENELRAIDAEMGPNPGPIPSERCGGESRRVLLKRKASRITRSTSEVFAYLTSKTSSIKEAADVLECFGNVSLFMITAGHVCILCIMCIFMHIYAYVSLLTFFFSPPLWQGMYHIAPFPPYQRMYCRRWCQM